MTFDVGRPIRQSCNGNRISLAIGIEDFLTININMVGLVVIKITCNARHNCVGVTFRKQNRIL